MWDSKIESNGNRNIISYIRNQYIVLFQTSLYIWGYISHLIYKDTSRRIIGVILNC